VAVALDAGDASSLFEFAQESLQLLLPVARPAELVQ
jgi:hypothetical protein